MRISELRKMLKAIEKEQGDLVIGRRSPEEDASILLETVEVRKRHGLDDDDIGEFGVLFVELC